MQSLAHMCPVTPPWTGGVYPSPLMESLPVMPGDWGADKQAEIPCSKLSNMADITCKASNSEIQPDILTRLDKIFIDFWKKLEHKLEQGQHQLALK
ncbi:Hypothetical predicted protein [Pelobates cultripes]|uniref:Uncharacterized protein n=1 Tax=Pelobates cultripes TaxID=61616 RepID=A0AAD1W7I0_PELCU|nr:Hypothetical predicted protein [Pelobates cultripes]